MDDPVYGKSDIAWTKSGNTWTLTNQAPAEPSIEQQMYQAEMAPDDERPFGSLPGRSRAGRDQSTPEERRAWKKQINRFMKNWKTGDPTEFDTSQGIQEMIDSGAISYDEDGLWISKPHMSTKDSDAMIDAADRWADETGLWQGKDFKPENYAPYGSDQQKMMKFGSKMGEMMGSAQTGQEREEMLREAYGYPNLSDAERQADRDRRVQQMLEGYSYGQDQPASSTDEWRERFEQNFGR
jgi:hypothetical protein